MPHPSAKDVVLIGKTRKPFGLKGEMKVTPQSDNLDRHRQLKEVYFQKHAKAPFIPLVVHSTRLHQGLWFIKFEKHHSPESLKYLSGGDLLVHKKNRLHLPDNMVFINDIIGFKVIDKHKGQIGAVSSVMEKPGQDLIKINLSSKPRQKLLIPWVDVFVQKIDTDSKTIFVDTEQLEGLAC